METRKIFGLTIPLWAALALIAVLPLVGFLIGSIGGFRGGTTTTVTASVTPQDIGLAPGQTRTMSVVVKNPKDYGVRVASISEGSSEAVEDGCPEGTVTSEPVSDPLGYIRPDGVNAYVITVTMVDNADERCLTQTLTLPLTVELSRR